MLHRIVLGLCLICTLSHAAAAQTKEDSISHSGTNIFRTLGEDVGHVVSAPFRMTRNDALRVAAVGGISTLFVLEIDEKVDEEYAVEDHLFPLGIPKALGRIGEFYDVINPVLFTAGLSLTLYGTALVTRNDKLRTTTGLMAESFLISQLLIIPAKVAFGRSRPFTDRGSRHFNFFSLNTKTAEKSLPSGHTAGMFAMMTVVAHQYPSWWVKLPAYTIAASVAFQRMDSRSHWASDVIMGAGLGYFVGHTLAKKHRGKQMSQSRQNSIAPYFALNRIGIVARF